MSSQSLQEDIAELQRLQELADRPKVKDVLGLHIRKWQTELIKLAEEEEAAAAAKQAAGEANADEKTEAVQAKPTGPKEKTIVKELRQYAWDQSDKFMKLYVDVPEVHTVPESNISAEFKARYAKVTATVNNISYVVNVGPFHSEIVTAESKIKVKSNKILIMLKKKKEKETWPYVISKSDKKTKPAVPAADENADPSASLMGMLQQMYEDGDDEMKRTIQKSWYQSQHGGGGGGGGGTGGMGGLGDMPDL